MKIRFQDEPCLYRGKGFPGLGSIAFSLKVGQFVIDTAVTRMHNDMLLCCRQNDSHQRVARRQECVAARSGHRRHSLRATRLFFCASTRISSDTSRLRPLHGRTCRGTKSVDTWLRPVWSSQRFDCLICAAICGVNAIRCRSGSLLATCKHDTTTLTVVRRTRTAPTPWSLSLTWLVPKSQRKSGA